MMACCPKKCSDKKAPKCLTSGRFIDYYNYDDQFNGEQAPVEGGGDMGDAGGGMAEGKSGGQSARGRGVRAVKVLAAAAERGDRAAISKLRRIRGTFAPATRDAAQLALHRAAKEQGATTQG